MDALFFFFVSVIFGCPQGELPRLAEVDEILAFIEKIGVDQVALDGGFVAPDIDIEGQKNENGSGATSAPAAAPSPTPAGAAGAGAASVAAAAVAGS